MQDQRKTCFVATPYGSNKADAPEDQKATYKLVNGLMEHIIRPAAQKCTAMGVAVDVTIGNDTPTGEHIWKKVCEYIFASDVVLGVVATPSPNTYIELGLAYGLWIEPIILQLDTTPLPSDLEGFEYQQFSKAQALGEEDASDVIEWVAQRLRTVPARSNRKTPQYLPGTTSSTGKILTYDRYSKGVPDLSPVVKAAQEEITIATPKGMKILDNSWAGLDDELPGFLVSKALNEGVDINIIMLHEDRVNEDLLKQNSFTATVEQYRSDILRATHIWNTARQSVEAQSQLVRGQGYEGKLGTFRVIKLHSLQLPFRVTMTEKRMILTVRLLGEKWNSRFCIDAAPSTETGDDTPIYELMRDELRLLMSANEERSEAEYQEWLELQA